MSHSEPAAFAIISQGCAGNFGRRPSLNKGRKGLDGTKGKNVAVNHYPLEVHFSEKEDEIMRRIISSFTLLSLSLVFYGLFPIGVAAQQTPRFLVTKFMSKPTSFGNLASATVVTVTNLAGSTCDVSVDFFDRFQTTPSCTVSLTIISNQPQRNFCAKDVSVRLASCDATCDPPLEFDEGRAVVNSSSDPRACKKLGVMASIFYFTSDENDLKGVSNPKIVKIIKGNKGD